jgi:hypothetical protein
MINEEYFFIEMECLICGVHKLCNPNKVNICMSCDNGVMKIVGE